MSDSDNEELVPLTRIKRLKSPTKQNELTELCKGYVPNNTKKQTNWVLRIFADWRACRNSNANAGTELCPSDLLENPNKEKLNHWLSLFVNEVRNTKGSQYPPRTIQQILAGLQRYLIEINSVDSYKFMDKKNSNFRDFHRACDSVYRQLHAGGVGVVVHHSKAFSVEEEDLFWNKGIMSDSNPVGLQRAVFFYVGKHFCWRGGDEQRKLGPSQFIRKSNPDSYNYIEHGSKNNSGGLYQLYFENKTVTTIALPSQRPKCLVYLLDLYLSKLPEFAFKEDVFYCRPKVRPAEKWYESSPVGKNKLGSIIAEMCREADICRRTNHSLHSTGATALFQNNIPESVILKTTGHRSEKALRVYEKVSMEQTEVVSKVMMAGSTSNEEKENTPPSQVGSIFGGLSSCTITNLTVNVNKKV